MSKEFRGVTFRADNIAIGVWQLPLHKKPTLNVQEGNVSYKVASFNSAETAEWFVEKFAKFLRAGGATVKDWRDDAKHG